MKLSLGLALGASLLSALGCSADAGDGAASSSDALICRACGYTPPPPRPPPPTVVCGAGGTLERTIALFTAGNVDATPSAIENEPVRFRFQIASNDPVGASIPVVLDGKTLDATMGSAGIATGSYTTPYSYALPTSPLNDLAHTLSVSGPCGTHSQVITLTGVAEKNVSPPRASLWANPAGYIPGQTVTLNWSVGDQAPRISDCAVDALQLGWSGKGEPSTTMHDAASIGAKGSQASTPVREFRNYQITGACTLHPALGRLTVASTPLYEAPAPAPVITSFTATPDRVLLGGGTSLAWSVDFSWCDDPAVFIVGNSRDRFDPNKPPPGPNQDGMQVFNYAEPAVSGSASVPVAISEHTRFYLTAKCLSSGSSAAAAPVDVTLYVAPQPHAASTCYEVDCKYSGCSTIAIPDGDDSVIDQAYPPQSGCTTSTIDCAHLADACGDPFGE